MKKELMKAQTLERLLLDLRKMGVYKHKKYELSNADITYCFLFGLAQKMELNHQK